MPIVQTNDAANRHVFIFKSLRFDVRVPQLMIGAFAGLVSTLFLFVASSPVEVLPHAPGAVATLARAFLSALVGVGGTILVLRRLGRRVTPVTPVAFWFEALRRELHAPRSEARVVHIVDPSVADYARSGTDRVVHLVRVPAQFARPPKSTRPSRSSRVCS